MCHLISAGLTACRPSYPPALIHPVTPHFATTDSDCPLPVLAHHPVQYAQMQMHHCVQSRTKAVHKPPPTASLPLLDTHTPTCAPPSPPCSVCGSLGAPRYLHKYVTKKSWPHFSQRARVNSCARMPHSKNLRRSRSTYPGTGFTTHPVRAASHTCGCQLC